MMRIWLKHNLMWLVYAAVVLIAAVPLCCYKQGPNPPPCANIENCNNPADYPPLWDAKKPDAGRDK